MKIYKRNLKKLMHNLDGYMEYIVHLDTRKYLKGRHIKIYKVSLWIWCEQNGLISLHIMGSGFDNPIFVGKINKCVDYIYHLYMSKVEKLEKI